MPLTPEEQAEMAQLQAQLGVAPLSTPATTAKRGLTDDEHNEMLRLQRELHPDQVGFLDKPIPVVGITSRKVIQGGLDTLPTAGMLAGGVMGGTGGTFGAGPVGTFAGGVAGGAVGGAVGEGLKSMGEQFILGQPKTATDIVENTGRGLRDGAMWEAGGRLVGGAGRLALASEAGQTAVEALSKAVSKGGEVLSNPVVRGLITAYEMMQHGQGSGLASFIGTDPHTIDAAGKIGRVGLDLLSTQPGQTLATKAAVEAARKFGPWDKAK